MDRSRRRRSSDLGPADGLIGDEGPNPGLSGIVRALERKGVGIGGDVVVTPSFHQLTPRIPALARRAYLAIDHVCTQLRIAFDVGHHPEHVPAIALGDVGSEACASKV